MSDVETGQEVEQEVLETQDGPAPGQVDNGEPSKEGSIQDRMAEGVEDDAWYSASSGAVVDSEGNHLTYPAGHPKAGQFFKNMDEYEKFKAAAPAQPSAKPKTGDKSNVLPFKKPTSFDSFFADKKGDVSPDKIFELSKGIQYQYKDELIPQVTASASAPAKVEDVDPVVKSQEQKAQWETLMLKPLETAHANLINAGLDEQTVLAVLNPIYLERKAMIDKEYKTIYDKAVKDLVDKQTRPITDKATYNETMTKSQCNLDAVSKQYFAENGKAAFFALVNGHQDGKNFVRGPSAIVMDLLSKAATVMDDKKFGNDDERNKFYQDLFIKSTADPSFANGLADVAYFYWLGKSYKGIYEKGKTAGAAESARINKVKKPQPASFAGALEEEDKNMPQMLRNVINAQR